MPYPGFKKSRDTQPVEQDRAYKLGNDAEHVGRTRRAPVDTAGKTENFFTANVKLITFIVTVAILLALIGPWSVFQIKKWYDANHVEEDVVLITSAELDALIARGPELTWRDFDGYTYEIIADSMVYMCQYDVEGGDYYLWVTSAKKGASIESVLLVDVKNGYEETEIKAVEK